MREYEDVAQRVVETVLGVPVVQYDTNSGYSVPDLRIDYPDRPPGYVEVVADNAQQAWRALDRKVEGGSRKLPVPGLSYDWWIYLRDTTLIKRLEPQLPDLLRRLERAGELFDHLVDGTLRRRIEASPFGAEINKLGIDRLVAGRQADGKAIVRYVLPGAEGPAALDLDRAVAWCGEFLSGPDRADVRRKLADTGARERHAFVVVGWCSEWAVLNLLSYDTNVLPDQAPQLPNEVTHLWLLGGPPAVRLIAWLPEFGGWVDYARGSWHHNRPAP